MVEIIENTEKNVKICLNDYEMGYLVLNDLKKYVGETFSEDYYQILSYFDLLSDKEACAYTLLECILDNQEYELLEDENTSLEELNTFFHNYGNGAELEIIFS